MSEIGIDLSPYSPMWPAVFDMEKRRLMEMFNDAVVVEHIGSTAVPGLGAKPIIDVMLGTPDIRLVESRIEALAAEGWVYKPEFERAMPDRRYFAKMDRPPGKFYMHAVPLGGAFWQRHIQFRDALRNHRHVADTYWKLKQTLAARFRDDRAGYIEGKSEFIRQVLAKFP